MTPSRDAPGRPAAGRPRRGLDASRDSVIFRAALDGLVDLGYDRLTMDEIATRARASKATLYRRWPSKATLIIDAIVAYRQANGPNDPPDTGSLTGDIEAIIATIPERQTDAGRHYAMVIGVVNAASHDPALRDTVSEHILGRPRRILRVMLERAAARGEVPAGRDLDVIADALLGLNMLRVATGGPINREHVAHVLRDVVYPLAIAPRRAHEHDSPG